MKLNELHEIHESPANWVLGVIYFAPRDPRLLVRKRIAALGWTLNFARPMALPFLLGTVAVFWAGLRGLASSDLSESLKWGGFLVLTGVLVGIWGWAANPRRYLD